MSNVFDQVAVVLVGLDFAVLAVGVVVAVVVVVPIIIMIIKKTAHVDITKAKIRSSKAKQYLTKTKSGTFDGL